MILRSNLKAVIAKLEHFQDGLPEACRQVLLPERWRKLLLATARTVLKGCTLAVPVEQRPPLLAHIEVVLASLTDEVLRDATRFALQFGHGQTWGIQPLLPGTDTGGVDALRVEDFDALRQQVYDWVENEKEWDPERDGEKTLENVAEKAEWILYIATSPALTSPLEQAARDAFLSPSDRGNGLYEKLVGGHDPHSDSPLDAATARQWAEAVLLAWSHLVAAELPLRLRAQLDTLVREVHTSLL